jgi:SAM-dependent methyltransferase
MPEKDANAAPGSHPADDEPLSESAPLARRMAPDLCRQDAVSGEDCAWYHGFWQYLRTLDIVTAPREHGRFFSRTLETLAGDGGYRRVLVSGTADYSMYAQILHAYRKENAACDVTVVDRCETPLFLCRWYGEHQGAPVSTVASNILDFDSARTFDVICTHSFLGYFDATERRRLMAKWHSLLRPGGKVVTIHRIRPESGGKLIGFTPAQAAAFRGRVARQAEKVKDSLDISPEELVEGARIYTERFKIHPVRSHQELVELFEGGGFSLEHFHSASVERRMGRQPSGPSAPGKAAYARIILLRS